VIAAVTDTHALIFHALGSKRLGQRARAIFNRCEEQEALIYVPVVVLWEIGVLARLGKIDLRRSLRRFASDLFSNPSYQAVEILPEHVSIAAERFPNEDPFDGLICAAARDLELPLLTKDAAIIDSGLVKTVW
jgi:PIN domain nuclease of toxin-antitoxin system